MIKIMLVEDEPPILRDLKALIETIGPDYKVTACAFDGQQAISLLQTDIPDILITDIQMPVIDGLGLISYIKEKDLDIIPIILSGYSEFEYAKKAISLNVQDYLLKPVKPEDLSKLLSQLSDKILSKKQMKRRTGILSLLEDNFSKANADELGLENSSYLLMLLCAGSFQHFSFDYHSSQKSFWEGFDLEKFGSSFLESGEEIWVFNGKTSAEKVILYTLCNTSNNRASFLADNFMNYLNSPRTPITMTVSPIVKKTVEIGPVLQTLRYLLRKNVVIGFSQIIKQYESEGQNDAVSLDLSSISDSLIDKLVFIIKLGDVMRFKSELRQIFQQLSDERYPQIYIEKLLREIVLNCRKSVSNSQISKNTDLELEISEAIYVSANYDELFNNLWYLFEELFKMKGKDHEDLNNTSLIMQKIEKYIKDNMAEPLNLQLLSEKFGLVPPYLSRLFKDYKGMSPIEYLTALRIEKAKELIKMQNTLFTKDIALIIGYSDPLYFSKIFKRETGLSPSEYKNTLKE